MIRQHVCIELTCDTDGCDPWDGEGAPHFASEQAAIRYAAATGWTVTEEVTRCPRCTNQHICRSNGHDWHPWRFGEIEGVAHHRRWCDRCGELEYDPPVDLLRARIAAAGRE